MIMSVIDKLSRHLNMSYVYVSYSHVYIRGFSISSTSKESIFILHIFFLSHSISI